MLDSNKILKSICRRKILKTLSKKKEVPIMQLVRITNSTYNEVNRNILILEKKDIVKQRYIDRSRLIRLNFQNEKTLLLIKIIRVMNGLLDEIR